MPVYNVREYIDECVLSLLNQQMDDYEIILVNDGSTDGSDMICIGYQNQYGNIRYLTQPNRGQSAARNHGLSIAEGEYILFVDSDDYIVPETCKVLYQVAKEKDADIVVGDILNEKDKIALDATFRWCPAENHCVKTLDYAKYSIDNGMYDIVPWIRLVKKDYLYNNSIVFMEGCYYEDHEYTMKLYTIGQGNVVKIRFPFYYYRMNRIGSTTNFASEKKGKDFLKVIKQMQSEVNTEDERISSVQYAAIGLAYFHFANLWVRISRKYTEKLYEEFMILMKEWPYCQEVLRTMPLEMQKKVRCFMKCRHILQIKYRVRKNFRL